MAQDAARSDRRWGNDPGCIALDHRFEHLEQHGGRVTARFENGKSYTGAALAGCDGGASRVRSLVFGSTEASYTGQAAFRALVPMSDVPNEVLANPYRVYVGRGQTLVHYPLRHDSLHKKKAASAGVRTESQTPKRGHATSAPPVSSPQAPGTMLQFGHKAPTSTRPPRPTAFDVLC